MYLPTDHTVLRGHKLIKPWMVLSDACDPRFYTSSFTIQSLYMREFLEVETVLVMLTTYPSLPFKKPLHETLPAASNYVLGQNVPSLQFTKCQKVQNKKRTFGLLLPFENVKQILILLLIDSQVIFSD